MPPVAEVVLIAAALPRADRVVRHVAAPPPRELAAAGDRVRAQAEPGPRDAARSAAPAKSRVPPAGRPQAPLATGLVAAASLGGLPRAVLPMTPRATGIRDRHRALLGGRAQRGVLPSPARVGQARAALTPDRARPGAAPGTGTDPSAAATRAPGAPDNLAGWIARVAGIARRAVTAAAATPHAGQRVVVAPTVPAVALNRGGPGPLPEPSIRTSGDPTGAVTCPDLR